MKSLSIVIVNWNSGEQLKKCVQYLATHRDAAIHLEKVVVIDNASTDGSAENIRSQSLTLRVIKNQSNIGFAAACNVGAKQCDSRYILFLNPDTIVYNGTLSTVISFMEDTQNQKVGICGAQLVDNNGKITPTCSRFPTVTTLLSQSIGFDKLLPNKYTSQLMVDWAHDENKRVDQVIGAFFLVRRCLFEEIGGFDESFFMYFEEVDFAYRAQLHGWQSYFITDAQAFHSGGGATANIKSLRLFYSLRSRIIYVLKHFNPISATIVILAGLFLEPICREVFSIKKLSMSDTIDTIRGYGELLYSLPTTVTIGMKARIRKKVYNVN
jgi:hypothetical protein